MSTELIVNLWAIYDSTSGFVYGLSGRAYNCSGTDEQKLALLKQLAATDYISAKRYEVPERFSVSYPDGSVKSKVTFLNAVSDPQAQLFEDMFKNIESELPPLPFFSESEYTTRKQKLPDDPLCVTTILYEDEQGNIQPIISDEDRAWVAEQEARLHL